MTTEFKDDYTCSWEPKILSILLSDEVSIMTKQEALHMFGLAAYRDGQIKVLRDHDAQNLPPKKSFIEWLKSFMKKS